MSIPSRENLPAVKAGDLARTAGASAKSMDEKVGKALQRLMIGNDVKGTTLRDELTKLNPSQQVELIKNLPFAFRERLTAELKQLPPSERGPQLVWLGNKELSGLGKDGYASVTSAEKVEIVGGRDVRTKYPSKIDLGGGKSIRAESTDGTGAFMVKLGSKELRAEWKGGGVWVWHERTRNLAPGDVMGESGKIWRPVTVPSKEERLMMTAFEAGAQVAQGSTGRFAEFGRFDPSTEQVFRDEAIDAQIPGVRKQLEALATATVKEGEWVKSAAEGMAMSQEWIAPALKKGHLTLEPSDDGGLRLQLHRAPGMSNGEWQKLQAEFGPKVAQYEKELQSDHSWLKTNVSAKERSARELVDTFFEPAYQKYLSTLPPPQRIAELTRISEAVKGTAAGSSLAESLFSASALGKDHQGNLVPTSEFGKMVLEGAWSTPEGREQLRELSLSMGPQLTGRSEDSFVRMFEVMRGKALSPQQDSALRVLHDITSPKEFDALLKPPKDASPEILQQAGDLSDLLSELGSASGTDKLRKAGAGLSGSTTEALGKAMETPARTLARGAHAVALFQVARSTRDLLTKGVSVDTTASFAEDATRAIGTWGAIAEAAGKTGFITKLGKVAGPVSDFIGLVNDMRRDASSSEGSYRNGVHVGASALILVGGLAGGPVGVAGVLVGLGVKLLYNRTSDSYEAQHASLKRTFGYR